MMMIFYLINYNDDGIVLNNIKKQCNNSINKPR